MRKVYLCLLTCAFLIPFVACKQEQVPASEKQEESSDPDPGTTDPSEEDPESQDPVWPIDPRWPRDPEAFDYDILQNRQAHLPPMDGTVFPITYDNVSYGSAMSLGSSGDKLVMQRAASASYKVAQSAGRFISIKINKPGTLSFVPRLANTTTIPTLYVTLVTYKDGEVDQVKNVLEKKLDNWTTSGNYDVLKAYRVYASVTEQDLSGIKESATLYVYCTDQQIIIYPLKWNEMSVQREYDVDAVAAALKAKVLNAPNTVDWSKISGTCYYVSNGGSDDNDGLSEASPIQTLTKVNSLPLKPGDAVLFRRGHTWRRDPDKLSWQYMISTKPGVTYSAYGVGDKPKFLGSPWNAAKEGSWTLTDRANVYVYDASFGKGAVGGMLLDGEICSLITPNYGISGYTYAKLSKDKTCIQDGDKLYIYSTGGNPSTRWQDIEVFVAGHTFRPMGDCVIDNLCILYCGSHGIGTGINLNLNLTVSNCEIGWIGGAYNHAGKDDQVRFGNGVQLWGGCESFVVDNCWIYQCFDTGITHQYSTSNNDDCFMKNIRYTGNLVEDCYYSIEWFLELLEGHERLMQNVLIDRNICRRAGGGWGYLRGTDTEHLMRHIQSWTNSNPAENFIISNNIFDGSVWPDEMFTVYARKESWQPKPINNLYLR